MKRMFFIGSAALAGLLTLSACTDVGYYAQCATGHIGVMLRCRPIESYLDDPKTSAQLKEKLASVLAVRQFAVDELGLPDNDSYRSYADVGRPYVVWNVVAADEFSLSPQQWCFPIAGCVSYRGYFSEDGAQSFAQTQRREGRDVYVYGVAAYSTLNWFDDPVLNTFLNRPKTALAGLIFHELSHQVVYAEGDSRFNEAFATTVEIEGIRRWLQWHDDAVGLAHFDTALKRKTQFIELILNLKGDLQRLYRDGLSENEKREAKADLLLAAESRYRDLREEWGGFSGYDAFFDGGLNNAKLVSVSTYQDLVPAFQRLLELAEHDLPVFYRRSAQLADLPEKERLSRLIASNRLEQFSPDFASR